MGLLALKFSVDPIEYGLWSGEFVTYNLSGDLDFTCCMSLPMKLSVQHFCLLCSVNIYIKNLCLWQKNGAFYLVVGGIIISFSILVIVFMNDVLQG